MNDFQENTWTAPQRELDAQICANFESLEAGFAATGVADAASGAAIVASIAKLAHTGRRAHWRSELARCGVLVPEEKPVPKAATGTASAAKVDAPPIPAVKGGKASDG